VVVVSGRGKDEVHASFCDSNSAALGLAAEHGYYFRRPQGPSSAEAAGADWQVVSAGHERDIDNSWRDVCNFVMSQYSKRTQGTTVEMKHSAVTWCVASLRSKISTWPRALKCISRAWCRSFREADPEYSKLQAAELKTHLESVLIRQGGFPVVIVSGEKYIEVRLKGVNKGELVLTVMRMLQDEPGGCPDFALCIGNDDHDEYMYSALHVIEGSSENETEGWYECLSKEKRQATIKVHHLSPARHL
jgi:trehalose 6-phosphate synthase/phosphatase